jgi:hypothetical protein
MPDSGNTTLLTDGIPTKDFAPLEREKKSSIAVSRGIMEDSLLISKGG